jgi:hypothetical protein
MVLFLCIRYTITLFSVAYYSFDHYTVDRLSRFRYAIAIVRVCVSKIEKDRQTILRRMRMRQVTSSRMNIG